MKNLKKTSYHFFSRFWPIISIFSLVFLFFWKVFISNQIPFPGDFVVGIYYPWLDYKWGYAVGVPVKNPIMADVPSFMYPIQTFAVSLLKMGKWPLWNPYILAGTPLMANFQSAAFSPANIFYFFMSYTHGWTFQIISAHLLAAIFTYLLLREWKISKLSSVLGGIIFSFSGYNLIWSQWNGHVITAACIPLIIFFAIRFITKGKIMDGVGVSFALALQVLGGYPQVVLYTGVTIAVLFFSYFTFAKEYFMRILILLIFLAIGFGISAIQLIPGAELLFYSQWSSEPHPSEWAFLPLQKTITFLAPDYFGNHATANYWGPQDYTSNTGFVGVSTMVVAFLSLFYFKTKKEIRFALFLAIVTLLISYKTPISLFLWSKNLFGMRSSSAHRALVLFNFSFAILASYGFDYFRIQKIRIKKYFLLLVPIFAILSLFLNLSIKTNNHVALRNMFYPIGFFVISIFIIYAVAFRQTWKKILAPILFCLIIFEIYRFGWKFIPFTDPSLVFPTTPVIDFLQKQQKPFRISSGNTMPVNFQMVYGFETLGGYETMRPQLSSQFIASLNNGDSYANPSGRYGIIDNDTSKLLELANTQYYLTTKIGKNGAPDPNGIIPIKFSKDRFSKVFEDKTVVVMESKNALQRAFLVNDWQQQKDDHQALSKLLDKNFDFGKKIILDTDLAIKPQQELEGNVHYLTYDSQSSEISVVSKNDAMLFVSDAWFPGWKAFLDKKPTSIYRADYAFRAVLIPKGQHIIEFVYQPNSFNVGLKISIFSLMLVFSLVLSKYDRRVYT